MPTQTNLKDYIFFPDGCKVEVKESGAGAYTDIGALGSDVKASLTWDENVYESANAGKLDKQIKNMQIEGEMTLINLNPDNLVRMAGGAFTKTTTAGSAVTTVPVQTIAAGWEGNTRINLVLLTSSTDSTPLRMATKPVISGVSLDPDGTPEALTEITASAGDYMIVEDSGSLSGWSIIINTLGISKGSPTTFPIAVTYGTNTPVAYTTLKCGASTVTLTPFAIKLTHTDDNGLKRYMELFSVDTSSGGFQFNYKSPLQKALKKCRFSSKQNLTQAAQAEISSSSGLMKLEPLEKINRRGASPFLINGERKWLMYWKKKSHVSSRARRPQKR
jgi:hypothetical protein